MSYLFIDSTYELTIGVLDNGFNWLVFEKLSGQKSSAVIQTRAYELLAAHGIKANELSGVITVNGPGFYTGLRLAEGFSDVFSFFGVKTFSFYSYEIPRWCGYEKGTWFTKAYRGEYFFYQWDLAEDNQLLLNANELSEKITEGQYFVHSEASLDTLSTPLIKNPIRTIDLLRDHPVKVFVEVTKDQKREPFYFRAPEDEFKVNP